MNPLNRDEDKRWSLRCRGCEMLIGCSHQQGCPEAGRATCVLVGHCDEPANSLNRDGEKRTDHDINCATNANFEDCGRDDCTCGFGEVMKIVDGFMDVLGWEKFMTVKERQSVNDSLDSYVDKVIQEAKTKCAGCGEPITESVLCGYCEND